MMKKEALAMTKDESIILQNRTMDTAKANGGEIDRVRVSVEDLHRRRQEKAMCVCLRYGNTPTATLGINTGCCTTLVHAEGHY